jgi:Caspase domain
MADPASESRSFYALLIACDFYFLNRLPNGRRFRNLGGCVRDITRVEEELLRGRLKVPPQNILKLTSSVNGDPEPPEPPEQRPTYDNIVQKFKELTDKAQAGDQVYIHYSGHGSRIRTHFTELKGENELDETLVPIDIADTSTRYVRDIDLAFILHKMIDKGAIVTLVLDSCHSGGATRNAGSEEIALRTFDGADPVDTTEGRPTDSKFASDAELTEAWRSLSKRGTRNASAGSGWLPEPEGYVLMAACRPSESAIEYAFTGQERNGVLTYWLMDAFKQLGPQLTWKLVHDRVLANVHSRFPSQTPQLQGEVGRVVFGVDKIPPHYAVGVLTVDEAGPRVQLNTGQALGVAAGAEFAIYPPGTTDFTGPEKRLALARIRELGATQSWADIIEEFGQQKIEPGAQAVLVDVFRLRRRVRLLTQEEHLTEAHKVALDAVKRSIGEAGRGFIQVADDQEAVEYQVGVSHDGQEFEILDPKGSPFPNLHPALEPTEGNAARVTERLVHLSKYHTVLELRNYDSQSRLAGKLKIELFKAPADYKRGDKPNPLPLDDPGNTPVINDGDKLFLHIKNESTQVLNVAVLDLQPDWGITQFYPWEERGDFIPVDPGKDDWVAGEFYLPGTLMEGTDVLKAFATVGPANFRWLELPALNQLRRDASTRGLRSGPRNPLEQLLAEIGAEATTMRNATPPIEASDEWVVAEVSVTVRKS